VFREQIERLEGAGVRFTRFPDLRQATDLDGVDCNVALTFDDGNASNERAFEFLACKAIPAAAFIVQSFAGRSGFMSPKDIARFATSCDFGCHGYSHIDMTSCRGRVLQHELAAPKAFIEDILGKEVDMLAAPYGRFDSRIMDAAQASGYRLLATSLPIPHRRPNLLVNRFCISARQGVCAPADLSARFNRRRVGTNVAAAQGA
jgi:peptidoglycan/xylan/chitin deacetylase (PgdA/CDA1 family)